MSSVIIFIFKSLISSTFKKFILFLILCICMCEREEVYVFPGFTGVLSHQTWELECELGTSSGTMKLLDVETFFRPSSNFITV